jgi:hypothetical protein
MLLRRTLMATLLALPLAAPAARGQEPQMPKPGPEHELLKQDAGTWDATVESWMAPNTPPMVSKGVDTSRIMGGFWLVTDFKSEFMNQPFEGHGVTGYDPSKKKYVSTWSDSMSPGLNLSEASYDAKTKTMTGWMEGPGPDGKPMKMRQVTEWKDADTKVFSMYGPAPDGKEVLAMRITYKRRK